MLKCVLIGCGAEIGSNLLIQNNRDRDGFAITTVITNAPPVDKHYPNLRPIDGIVARLALAKPGVQNDIEVLDESRIRLFGRTVSFQFYDLRADDLDLAETFDIAILATSKNDITATSQVGAKVRAIAGIVLGVAESNDLPSIYGGLGDLSSSDISTIEKSVIAPGMYCLGSCQTNGMHASLRVVLQAIRPLGLTGADVLSIETDIVHPDTPNGVLGTRSFEGRLQDARDNLRPSFSQIAQSQHKVMPWAPLTNTISLRAPVHAPGYQINRFVVKDAGRLTISDVEAAISSVHELLPHLVMATDVPLGSRAYSNDARCATIVADANHLLLLRPSYLASQGLTELILQSFVNNTVGYSAIVMAVAREIALGRPLATFRRL